jgi:hypothetical protein
MTGSGGAGTSLVPSEPILIQDTSSEDERLQLLSTNAPVTLCSDDTILCPVPSGDTNVYAFARLAADLIDTNGTTEHEGDALEVTSVETSAFSLVIHVSCNGAQARLTVRASFDVCGCLRPC